MVHLKRLLAVSPLVANVVAQADGDKVWAAVAFINHGETTPLVGELRTILTPEGAQQMLRQGTAFRARYFRNSVNDSDYADVQTAYFQNLDADVIDNDNLDILSETDEWVSAGAMAFMQGLYPPSYLLDENAGGREVALDLTVSDNTTSYPLNGYQYPNIRTVDYMDPSFTALEGTSRCSAWEAETRFNLTQDEQLSSLYEGTLAFYQNLFSQPPLEGTIDVANAHLWNAYPIWQYVDYMYRHNETVYNDLEDAETVLSRLNQYATILVRAQNSYLNSEGDDDPLDVLYSIAGRMLANKVTQQFESNIRWDGDYSKLSLLFGSLEPIMSFVSLVGLLTEDNIIQAPWSTLPEPGAALVFELFGQDPDFPDEQPSTDSLRVRMSYRASADANETFANQAIFKSGPDGIAYSKFLDTMQNLGRTTKDWCNICSPTPAPWCVLTEVAELPTGRSTIEPAVAGVIGAVVMLAVLAIIFAGLYILGGVRLGRKTPPPQEPESVTAAGGFKGPERKEGDPDVVVTKTGAHHERVGSWELRGGGLPPQTSGIVTKDLGPEGRRSLSDDEDDVSVMGATPVKARENV
ncbi:hypothetical protein FDECE_9988 [Fusarium decemcellulare]|nr:hypothetical protein FDECE_9988 [Fusarium decemcellulare]